VRCLLDTHILLWSLLEPDRLSSQVRQVLDDPGNELWLSPISLWEITILAAKGRLHIESQDINAWLREVMSRTPLREAPLTFEVALTSRTIDVSHQDPADRFIAATAQVHDLVLVTVDQRLLQCGQVQTLS